MEYLDLFFSAFLGTLDWTWRSICLDVPWTRNYFWGLIVISLIVYGLELLFPWRKQQAILRKDFFLDGFYMFFNFFIFSIFISGFYKIVMKLVVDEFQISANSIAVINLSILSPLVQLLLFFVVLDFVVLFDGGFSGLVIINFSAESAVEIYTNYMTHMGIPANELAKSHTADEVSDVMGELMNQIVGDFTSTVGHELHTSITQIRTLIE